MGCRFTAAERCPTLPRFWGSFLGATLRYALLCCTLRLPCSMSRFKSRAQGGISGHHKCTPVFWFLRQYIHPCFFLWTKDNIVPHNTRQDRATIFNQGRQSRAWYFSMLLTGPTDTRPVTSGCVAKYLLVYQVYQAIGSSKTNGNDSGRQSRIAKAANS
jgi:hypothetical protein